MSDTAKEVISLFEDFFYAKPGDITSDSKLEDIVSDSMDFIELISILTTHFKIKVVPEDVKGIETVGDVITFIEQKPKSMSGDELQRF